MRWCVSAEWGPLRTSRKFHQTHFTLAGWCCMLTFNYRSFWEFVLRWAQSRRVSDGNNEKENEEVLVSGDLCYCAPRLQTWKSIWVPLFPHLFHSSNQQFTLAHQQVTHISLLLSIPTVLPQFRPHCVSPKLLYYVRMSTGSTLLGLILKPALLCSQTFSGSPLSSEWRRKFSWPVFLMLCTLSVFIFMFLLFCPIVNKTMCWWSVLTSYFLTPHLIHPYILLASNICRMWSSSMIFVEWMNSGNMISAPQIWIHLKVAWYMVGILIMASTFMFI